jgi:hypothetical protein
VLCINNYTQKYVDECRSKVKSQISAYKNLVTTAGSQNGTNKTILNAAIKSFERFFFNNMVLVLENHFVHRSRTMEGKDGTPLNEVRILCNSMMNNNNKMCTDKTIKFNPAKSVLNTRGEMKSN